MTLNKAKLSLTTAHKFTNTHLMHTLKASPNLTSGFHGITWWPNSTRLSDNSVWYTRYTHLTFATSRANKTLHGSSGPLIFYTYVYVCILMYTRPIHPSWSLIITKWGELSQTWLYNPTSLRQFNQIWINSKPDVFILVYVSFVLVWKCLRRGKAGNEFGQTVHRAFDDGPNKRIPQRLIRENCWAHCSN